MPRRRRSVVWADAENDTDLFVPRETWELTLFVVVVVILFSECTTCVVSSATTAGEESAELLLLFLFDGIIGILSDDADDEFEGFPRTCVLPSARRRTSTGLFGFIGERVRSEWDR